MKAQTAGKRLGICLGVGIISIIIFTAIGSIRESSIWFIGTVLSMPLMGIIYGIITRRNRKEHDG